MKRKQCRLIVKTQYSMLNVKYHFYPCFEIIFFANLQKQRRLLLKPQSQQSRTECPLVLSSERELIIPTNFPNLHNFTEHFANWNSLIDVAVHTTRSLWPACVGTARFQQLLLTLQLFTTEPALESVTEPLNQLISVHIKEHGLA